MSFEDEVREVLDRRIESIRNGIESADSFDGAILSIILGTLEDLKKELKL